MFILLISWNCDSKQGFYFSFQIWATPNSRGPFQPWPLSSHVKEHFWGETRQKYIYFLCILWPLWCREPVKRHRQGLTINPLPLSCLISLQSLVMWCKLKLWTVYEEIPPLPPPSTLTCFACSHCGSVAPDHISTSIINYRCLHAFVHPQTHSSISQTNLCSSTAAATAVSLPRTYKSGRAPVCRRSRANTCS